MRDPEDVSQVNCEIHKFFFTQMTIDVRPAEGAYQEIGVYREGKIVAPLAAPDRAVDVSALLPPITN